MKIISTHLFDVVEALKSPHLALKELIEFFNNVRSNLHVFGKHHFINFPLTNVIDFNTICFVC
jgi:hypothetical protein